MGYFLPFYSPKNQNFEKMKKMPGDIIILHMCTKNYDQMMYGSWDMVRDGQTDRRTDGRKKWHIEVGAPSKNNYPNGQTACKINFCYIYYSKSALQKIGFCGLHLCELVLFRQFWGRNYCEFNQEKTESPQTTPFCLHYQ